MAPLRCQGAALPERMLEHGARERTVPDEQIAGCPVVGDTPWHTWPPILYYEKESGIASLTPASVGYESAGKVFHVSFNKGGIRPCAHA